VFPKLKEKIIVQALPAQMGGMIANAACVYASFGHKAKFLAALNGGEISNKLCEGLQAVGIDTYITRDDNLPDSKTIIILAEDEHTVFIPTMNLRHFEISEQTLQEVCGAEYVYSNFCELKPLRCGELTVLDILKKVRDSGCQICCDIDVADISEEDDALFDYVDTLFVNEIGFSSLKKDLSEDKFSELLFARGIKTFVVTLAENGCKVFTKDNGFQIHGISVPVVDVTGAGDTFCASFLYASSRTDDLQICAEFANYAAARAVMGIGARAGACSIDTVLDFICKNGGNYERYRILKEEE
jgi:ribokinase